MLNLVQSLVQIACACTLYIHSGSNALPADESILTLQQALMSLSRRLYHCAKLDWSTNHDKPIWTQGMKRILAINGSASTNSANQRLIESIAALTSDFFTLTVFAGLKTLPHFDPELSIENAPEAIVALRQAIQSTDGIIICTPEYVFSIPSGLKNLIEWCVSTTVFTNKPTGIITASASGVRGHEELQLIMQTVMARFNPDTILLIQGVKGKVDQQGKIIDEKTKEELSRFIQAFRLLTNLGNS